MPQTFKLFSSQLTESNLLTLQIFLGLTKTDRLVVWEHTDDPQSAAAVLIDVDNDAGRLELREWMSGSKKWMSGNKSQVLIAFGSQIAGLPNYILTLSRPIRSAELLSVLQQAADECLGKDNSQQKEQRAVGSVSQPAVESSRKPSTASSHETKRALGIVYSSQDKLLKLTDKIGRVAIFDIRQRRYYTSNLVRSAVEDMLASLARDIQIEELSTAQFQKETQSLKPQDSDPLLWTATLAISEGQLFGDLSLGEVYRLNRWPDLKKLGPDALHMKLAALLRNGGTIDNFARFTQVPTESIINFINVCFVLGYLDRPKKIIVPAAQKKTSDEKRGLFARIRSRLGI